MTTGAEIVAAARGWVGVPFRHQGRDREAGVDCVGLVIVVAQELGLVPANFERNDYGRLPTRGELDAKIMQHCTPTELTPGCVCAIRWNKELAHVAIFTGDTLIHSYESVGKVVEHGFRGRWVRLVDSTWRLPGHE